MKTKYLLFLALIFLSATRVKAEADHNSGRPEEATQLFVDRPTGCYQKVEYPCAIRIFSKVDQEFQWTGHKFMIRKGSSFVLESEKQMRFLDGAYWIERAEHLTVRFGVVEAIAAGESFVEALPEGVWSIKNLRGQVEIKSSRTKSDREVILAGFENWYHGPSWADRGVIKPINQSLFWSQWNRIGHFSRAELIDKIRTYKSLWKESVEQSSQIYQQSVQRKIASIENREDKKLKAAKKAQVEKKDLQMKFRKRYFMEDEK